MYISVIIPTYNRRPILEQCLRALAQQQPGPYEGYEVVVVDDGSTDGTVEWLQNNPVGLPQWKLLQQEHRGPAAARNLGFRHAQGSLIVFIDSDLVVVDHFLASHAQMLRRHGVTGDPRSPPRGQGLHLRAGDQHEQFSGSPLRTLQAHRFFGSLFRHRQRGHCPPLVGAGLRNPRRPL